MSTNSTRRPPRASTAVEDFDRLPAAQAAVALRRGPGCARALERTFHWGTDTHGLVVAQEPPAGSKVPLDSTVLLFVSAPGERETEPDTPEPVKGEADVSARPADAQSAPGAGRTGRDFRRRRPVRPGSRPKERRES